MWNGRTLSVVLPTYNEKDSIAETIRAFDKLGIVDDILVVNNNAAPGTSDEVAMTSAREVLEPRQGYGAAIRRGLAEVDTDLICICEPDGTFNPRDLMKLLPFTEDCDFVVGSRTVSNFIWDGANMGWFLRWGNWAVAKIIEVLFNTSYLSDVGCTFRVISRSLVPGLLRDARVYGSSFGLEMLMLAVVGRDTIVQVPVNYHPRVGTSAITGDTGTPSASGWRCCGWSWPSGSGRPFAGLDRNIAARPSSTHPDRRTRIRWCLGRGRLWVMRRGRGTVRGPRSRRRRCCRGGRGRR